MVDPGARERRRQITETPSSEANRAVVASLASQLEEAKFAWLLRFMADLPDERDNLELKATPHGPGSTELLVRMIGKVSALSRWAVSWVFQSASLPVGLWSEAVVTRRLGERLDLAAGDLDRHKDALMVLYARRIERPNVMQYPIVTDLNHHMPTNVDPALADSRMEALDARFDRTSAKFAGLVREFGVGTPSSMVQYGGDRLVRFIVDLLNTPSSYHFVASEGRISIVPVTEHGW